MARSAPYPGHIEYFKTLCAESSDPKWSIGLAASESYEQYRSEHNPEILHDLIKEFMPHRFSGTEFHGLWGNILGAVSNLPIHIQVPLWNNVFDKENQGEQLIPHNETAKTIVKKWLEMDHNKKLMSDEKTIMEFADSSYQYFPASLEWSMLFYTIEIWYKTINSDFSLIDYIIGLMKPD